LKFQRAGWGGWFFSNVSSHFPNRLNRVGRQAKKEKKNREMYKKKRADKTSVRPSWNCLAKLKNSFVTFASFPFFYFLSFLFLTFLIVMTGRGWGEMMEEQDPFSSFSFLFLPPGYPSSSVRERGG
jgi:hypothetical protein